MATHLYAACQAIDLRVIELSFRAELGNVLAASLELHLGPFLETEEISSLSAKMKEMICRRLEQTTSLDSDARFEDACGFVTSFAVEALSKSTLAYNNNNNPLSSLDQWRISTSTQLAQLYRKTRNDFFVNSSSAESYLGKGTKPLYAFVRKSLGVRARRGDVALGSHEATIGRSVAMIHEAIRSGSMYGPLLESMSTAA
jgi:phenylalanine ammonia-lyase